jgi:hypothetical protein
VWSFVRQQNENKVLQRDAWISVRAHSQAPPAIVCEAVVEDVESTAEGLLPSAGRAARIGGSSAVRMAEDHVTIDPEFLPPRRPRGPTRTKGWIAAIAAVLVALTFGWLTRTPPAADSADAEAVDSTTTTTVPAETVVEPAVYAELDIPLGEAVPGFTDTVVMLATPARSFEVMRWRAASATAEVMLSLPRGEVGWGSGAPWGLDASGSWFAEHLDSGLLVAHETTGTQVDPELIGVRVGMSVWHDTDPGRIAWVECARAGDAATLYSLELADPFAEPVELRSLETSCDAVWLVRWGDRGVVAEEPWGGGSAVLAGAAADMPVEPGSRLVAEAPDGTTLWSRTDGDANSSSAFLLPPDGGERLAVAGLAVGEDPAAALWSPDGAHLALWLEGPQPVLRIVATSSGRILHEAERPDLIDGAWAWSTDGRFLLYQRRASTGWKLVFYDSATGTATEVGLRDVVDEIRASPPAIGLGEPPPAGSEVEIDASGAAATGETPLPDLDHARAGDDGTERLPLGVVTEIPPTNRLDFLYERCAGPVCHRDAVFVNRDDRSLVSAAWEPDRPFHVRHGFINESDEPLGDEFDVVLYTYRMVADGPTYRYTSDYVLRGSTDECGPTYRTTTGPVTCEWFVHEFPDGLPAGRNALWAFWEAPCWAWSDLGFVDGCTNPDEVMALFAAGVDSPWEATAVTWDDR